MGKIKIGLIILGSIAVVGLVVAGIVTAQSPLGVIDSDKVQFVPDEIIVKFKGDIKPFRVIKVPTGQVGEKIKEYLARKDIVYAEPNYYAYALMTPNDPYYNYQWHLDNPVYGGINMEAAWDISTGDHSVVVAIVDTGIAYENYGKYCQAPDLANACFVAGYDFVNKDSHPNDDNQHGTHVAGTIAQSTNNSLGVAGIAFNTCLMPVKALNRWGSGTYADIAEGVRYAADNGAKIINLSLGGSASGSVLQDAVAYAYEKGVTVIAACGNDNTNQCSYPAAYDDYVIAVGATQYDETKAPYSNYGSSLDLVAPGGNNDLDQNNDGYVDGVLQQTFRSSWQVCSFSYYFSQGTSMAAPHVAGVAALLITNGNATTPDEVRAALQETAEDLGTPGPDETYGWGLVDAAAAFGWALAPECTVNADCDDSLYCNGVETCQGGVCQPATPVDCNDGNFCTTDFCYESASTTEGWICVNVAVADGTSCGDGLYCDGVETCQAGICQVGTSVNCDDGIACTIDSCDEVNDVCINDTDNSYCDNGLYCDGAEVCDAILGCQDGAPVECSDLDSCTIDACNESSDICEYSAITICTNDDGCCPASCDYTIDNDCSIAEICWSGDYQYLYRNSRQARKFCKCVQGIYGYQSYSYTWGRESVYQYNDTGDNENWDASSRSSYLPVYQVKCIDGLYYPTDQDYYYPQ